jgi:hypothetical protein
MRPKSLITRINYMTQNIHKLFKNLNNIEPSRGLEGRILQAISAEEKKSIRVKIMLIYAGFASSIILLLYAVFSFEQAFLQSEFWSLLSLSISDAGTVMKYGGDYIFSLLETFPVILAVIFLVPLFVFFLSLSSYFRLNNSNHYNHI